MDAEWIREDFSQFFKENGHAIVSSASLLPTAPNLLFTNAGMNPFVPYFLGQRPSPHGRIADVQKCIRAGGKHNDLDDVGYDSYHHTFFEMLGNWSFGDYFKEEAIRWAWEWLVERLHMPKERLYVTVYRPNIGEPAEFDGEAHAIWTDVFRRAGLNPAEHITYGGAKDNFWMMGATGPCGPCTEIHMDLTERGDCGVALVNQGNPRCMELWNLVFIQYNALGDGHFEKLPLHYVDTGMGLERVAGIAATTNGFTNFAREPSNYASDLFAPIFQRICELCDGSISYGETIPKNRRALGQRELLDCSFRVIADHVRALTMAIADGIFPGNEGRSYVLRRILRRAVLFGRRLKLQGNFLADLAKICAHTLRALPHHGAFPVSFESPKDIIPSILNSEQDAFERTLDRGLQLLEESMAHNDKIIPGKILFELHDTYGFPVDLSQLVAAERGIAVDLDGFERAMDEQKTRARAAKKEQKIIVEEGSSQGTPFVGYQLLLDGGPHRAILLQILPREGSGQFLVFDSSPFYGEKGGQVGDCGTVTIGEKIYEIVDTQCSQDGKLLHAVLDFVGENMVEKTALLAVNFKRRQQIAAHHTATHILQTSLRQIIGTHISQAGSLVNEAQLRFDFTHFQPLTEEQLVQIEKFANRIVRKNTAVHVFETDFDRRPSHCLAHFGERYGSRVRVVEIGDSAELCGGTHVDATGEIGIIKILSEGGIAAGVRRIVAVAGEVAQNLLTDTFQRQKKLALDFHCDVAGVENAVNGLRERVKTLERKLKRMDDEAAQHQLAELSAKAEKLGDWALMQEKISVGDTNTLRTIASQLAARFPKNSFLLCAPLDGAFVFAVTCGRDAIARGQSAREIATNFAEKTGGRGGGKDDFAAGTTPAIPSRLTVV
ncbi:MAG: alanine--tRNA ligase [Puniceicoccales bacterium]|jgi:alanyl-tRNA synthetase|nr:alanine--tRNA ligase [Puniceicoccales bacterium]